MKKQLLLFALVGLMTSCSNEVRNIPSGYVGKELTPTGYGADILEAGQVDLGEVGNNGQYTTLILLEASTITIKEEFHQAGGADKEDHRVMTETTPLTVDIRVQVGLPKDRKLRDAAFAGNTPIPTQGDVRLSTITLTDIYNRFASMTVRGKVRGIFSKYRDWDDVMKNYEKVNGEIAQMVLDVFKSSNTPLDLLNVQLSNVKEDEQIWASKNENQAAVAKVNAINQIGDAIRNNPGYIKARKWDVIEQLIKSPNAANITLIIGDDKNADPVLTMPVGSKKDTARK